MPQALTNMIRERWNKDFLDIEAYGPPHNFSPRKLAGLYAVASICYHGNDHNLISDPAFDKLCHWLRNNFERCKAEGADMLDIDLLNSNSGFDVKIFVRPYHDIVAALLGHPCRCVNCRK